MIVQGQLGLVVGTLHLFKHYALYSGMSMTDMQVVVGKEERSAADQNFISTASASYTSPLMAQLEVRMYSCHPSSLHFMCPTSNYDLCLAYITLGRCWNII